MWKFSSLGTVGNPKKHVFVLFCDWGHSCFLFIEPKKGKKLKNKQTKPSTPAKPSTPQKPSTPVKPTDPVEKDKTDLSETQDLPSSISKENSTLGMPAVSICGNNSLVIKVRWIGLQAYFKFVLKSQDFCGFQNNFEKGVEKRSISSLWLVECEVMALWISPLLQSQLGHHFGFNSLDLYCNIW